jgi:hypothetical protein
MQADHDCVDTIYMSTLGNDAADRQGLWQQRLSIRMESNPGPP